MDLKKQDSSTGMASTSDPIGKITGFLLFRNLISSYSTDKNSNDNERKNIKKYGVISLILSFIALAVSLSCLITRLLGLDVVGFSYVLVNVIYIMGGIIVSLLLAIYGFVFGIMQIRLNRKSVGIFGLIVSILAIVTSVLLIVFLII